MSKYVKFRFHNKINEYYIMNYVESKMATSKAPDNLYLSSNNSIIIGINILKISFKIKYMKQ